MQHDTEAEQRALEFCLRILVLATLRVSTGRMGTPTLL